MTSPPHPSSRTPMLLNAFPFEGTCVRSRTDASYYFMAYRIHSCSIIGATLAFLSLSLSLRLACTRDDLAEDADGEGCGRQTHQLVPHQRCHQYPHEITGAALMLSSTPGRLAPAVAPVRNCVDSRRRGAIERVDTRWALIDGDEVYHGHAWDRQSRSFVGVTYARFVLVQFRCNEKGVETWECGMRFIRIDCTLQALGQSRWQCPMMRLGHHRKADNYICWGLDRSSRY